MLAYRGYDFWYVDRRAFTDDSVMACAVTCYRLAGHERNPSYIWLCDIETLGM